MSFKIARMLLKNPGMFCSSIFRSYEKRAFASSSKKKDKCECKPEIYDYEPDYEIQKTPVIEKKCKPCSFWDWKPKEPQLMKAVKQKPQKKEKKKKKRDLKKCYPEMVVKDDCPARKKRVAPKWSEVFPNNVCQFKCKSEVEKEEEKAAVKIEQQIKRKRKKKETPRIPCPGPDWDHSGHLD